MSDVSSYALLELVKGDEYKVYYISIKKSVATSKGNYIEKQYTNISDLYGDIVKDLDTYNLYGCGNINNDKIKNDLKKVYFFKLEI